MAKYKISARVDGVMKTHIVDALDKDDAAQYGFCMWDVEDVFVEEVEDPSHADARWIEEHDDTVNRIIYTCSNCGAVFDGLPRSPFCPSCKVLMTGGK